MSPDTAARAGAVVVLLALGAGCPSGVDVPATDSGARADARTDGALWSPEAPRLPDAPALPSMAPCPEGWREVVEEEEGITLCEPWPTTGRADCPAGQAHFAGTAGCAVVGAPCPVGEWPEDLPTGLPAGARVWHVRPGASGGDGSEALPYGTVFEAASRAADGDVIALAKGVHRQMPLGRDLEVVGACAAETRVIASGADRWAVLVMGAHATVRNVTIGPTPGFGVVASGADSSITLRGAVVEDATGAAVAVGLGAHVSLEGVRVIDPRLDADGRAIGVAVQGASTATLHEVTVEGAKNAIDVSEASTLTMERVAVWGTGGAEGTCLKVRGGGSATGTGFLCEDQVGTGIRGDVGGSTIDLTSLVVRRVSGVEEFGRGVSIEGNSSLRLSKALIEAVTEMGILQGDAGPSFRATGVYSDVVIRDMRSRPDGVSGTGFLISGDAEATVTRLATLRTFHDGIVVQNGALLMATDLTLRDSRPAPASGNGSALYVGGGRVVLDRVDIARSSISGVVFDEAQVEAANLAIHDSQPSAEGTMGFGMFLYRGSDVRVDGLLVEGSRGSQVFLEGASHGTFADLTVRDGQAEPRTGMGGIGLMVGDGSSVDVTRARIERHRAFGVLFTHAPDPSTLHDVVIDETERVTCEACTPFGSGLGVFSSEVSVSSFSIRGSAVCGVHIGDGAGLDLSMGEVVRAEIGACVTDAVYDLSRLQMDVAYRDNGTNLDSTSLPVPSVDLETPDFSRR